MIPHRPMEQNLGIDTKIKSVALSDPKLQFSRRFALLWPQMAKMATQVSLRCLKVIPIDSPCPKAWPAGDRHQNQVCSTFQTKVMI